MKIRFYGVDFGMKFGYHKMIYDYSVYRCLNLWLFSIEIETEWDGKDD